MNIANKGDASKLNLPLKMTTEPMPVKEKSPTTTKDGKEAKNISMSSPTKKPEDKKPEPPKPILMTRRELTDPFGSDDEDEPPPPPANNLKLNGGVNGELNSDDAKGDVFADLPKPNPVSYVFLAG